MLKLQLTEEQKRFFHTFGYLVLPGVLKHRIEELKKEFDSVHERYSENKHNGRKRTLILPFIDHSEVFSSFLDDGNEIHDIAANLLGEDFNYISSDGNYYTGDTAWHSDPGDEYAGSTADGLIFMKIAIYFDQVTWDTGALRVIPGSHRRGDKFADDLEREITSRNGNNPLNVSDRVWGISGAEVPSVALESRPGDVVVFNHLLQHASFGGSSRRSMLAINVCKRYDPERILDFHKILSLYISLIGYSEYKIEAPYGEIMLQTATKDRRVHLAQALEHYKSARELLV